jgi:hypothetical protein
MKEKENEFIILEQPGKSILSIILVDGDFPMSEESHAGIERLREVSDIFFIIPESSSRNLVARNFGSLYQGLGYIVGGKGITNSELLMKTFEYDKEIFGNHILVLITQLSDFSKLGGERLQGIAASSLVKPIMKTRRLTSQEFYEIYKAREEKIIYKYLPIIHEGSSERIYTTHIGITPEILLRPASIQKILEFWEKEDDKGFTGVGYVCSFTQPDLRYFMASLLKRMRLGILEVEPETL